MHRTNILFLIVLLIAFAVSPLAAANRAKMWAEVDKAVSEGLPKTAVEKLYPIIASAVTDKKFTEAARAICKKIVLEGNIQGNKAEEKIVRLEKEIETADASLRPLLRVVLARWYWHYFQQNNWRFLDRSRTEGLDEKDFTTWDLPKLFNKIGSLYESVLADEAQLQAAPLSELDEILDRGNQPSELRPTVFDFYAHQALEFYTSGEQAGAAPLEAFEIDAASPVFDDAKAFVAWNVVATDTTSPKYRSLKLYQRLLKFHLDRADLSALIDVDLARLRWANAVATPNGRSDRYIERLKAIAAEYISNPVANMALAMCAEELNSRGQRKEAWNIANEGRKRFPVSDGGILCQNLIIQLESKQLQAVTERVSGTPGAQVKVSWCNIDQVHFKLVDLSDWELFRDNAYDTENFTWDETQQILNQKAAATWVTKLEPTPDFAVKSMLVDLPPMKPGLYMLFASWKPDFSRENNAIRYTTVWYSKLGLVVRNRNGICDGLLADNNTGKPIAGGEIEAYTFNYDKGWKRQGAVKTDADGVFRFDAKLDGAVLVARADGERITHPGRTSSWAPGRRGAEERVFFFTDRGLYRPGQTIQFKAVCVRIDTEKNRYETLPDRSFTVSFRDVNGEEIAKAEVKTNDFGSCQGSFTAPTGRLTGAMTLEGVGIDGSAGIRVEEYKRPKFKVTLEPPAEAAKLNEEVVLTGLAQSYTMAAIDGAEVKFRVTREAQLPPWCWWCIVPSGGSQEIAHGKLVTDAQGRFTIRFPAKPDTSIPEENQPIFTYRVSADITDSAGETRSQSLGIRIGYTALELGVSTPSWIHAGKAFQASLSTRTLDGKGIPAGGKLTVTALADPEKMPRRSGFPWEAGEADPTQIFTWKDGKQISEHEFNTSVDGTGGVQLTLPAGAYRLTVKARDRFNKEVVTKETLVVVDPAATSWNVREPSRFTVQNSSPEVGDTFRALWGTGYETGRGYVEIEQRGRILEKYWTPEGQTQHLIELPIKESLRGGFTIRVTYFRENRVYLHQNQIFVPWSNKRLNLSFAHFTSKMKPGQEESWTVTVKGPEAEAQAIELAAALYDASLDAFQPFDWMRGFSFFYSDASAAQQSEANLQKHLSSLCEDWNISGNGVYRQYPQLKGDLVTNFMGYAMSRAKCLSFADSEMMPQAMAEGAMPVPSPAMAPSMDMAVDEIKEKRSDATNLAVGGAAAPREPRGEPAPKAAAQTPDLDKVSARTNLNETAFFLPQLISNEKNEVVLKFTMPEALTTWKFLGFAHGKACQSGGLTAETVTQKDLMVQPNPPRFLREGDQIAFTAKITNMTDKPLEGRVRMNLSDPATGADRAKEFGIAASEQTFTVPAKESRTIAWDLNVPDGAGIVAYKVVGAAGNVSDGEENLLPVLSRRILVREALPLPIRGPATKAFKLQKLIDSATSTTLRTESLTVQMTSNPAWYAVQALPYLMEFPHECAEQM
ncbi:MAG TPA: alpha-2-macroglobulin family protein, partial [Candidatus Ozemobacteraceae bacterium]